MFLSLLLLSFSCILNCFVVVFALFCLLLSKAPRIIAIVAVIASTTTNRQAMRWRCGRAHLAALCEIVLLLYEGVHVVLVFYS